MLSCKSAGQTKSQLRDNQAVSPSNFRNQRSLVCEILFFNHGSRMSRLTWRSLHFLLCHESSRLQTIAMIRDVSLSKWSVWQISSTNRSNASTPCRCRGCWRACEVISLVASSGTISRWSRSSEDFAIYVGRFTHSWLPKISLAVRHTKTSKLDRIYGNVPYALLLAF